MSQPSVANYFATRKRTAHEENNILRAKKVLILESGNEIKSDKKQVTTRNEIIYSESKVKSARKELIMIKEKESLSQKCVSFPERSKVITKLDFDGDSAPKRGRPPKHKKINNQGDIQKMLQTMQNKQNEAPPERTIINRTNMQKVNEKTPPASPMKSAMDNVVKSDMSLGEIKTKLTRSARLADLKASIAKFNKSADQLKAAEKKTAEVMKSPALNKFRSIELEVQLSPKKQVSPVKAYLSPMKESPRKNLFGMQSPVKTTLTSPQKIPAYQKFAYLASPGKPTLTLPYHYRHLAELFRSIDTVCSMIFNRKETITFAKIKPAVQEMTRKNLDESHFAQIKSIYPDSFELSREKMRIYGSCNERYELIVKPQVPEGTNMNPTLLLERKRVLFNKLIDKVKVCHTEFLGTLDPPMVIPPEKLTRWHPEFDIEKIPDIEIAEIPQPPDENKLTTGQEVLEKARQLFNCNTRMEKALERFKKVQEDRSKVSEDGKSSPIANILKNVPQTVINKNMGLESDMKASSTQSKPSLPSNSLLKGIPQSLLEKVRAKQAAKALDAMTRSTNQDKDALVYSCLPDIARLIRSTYVAEKKGVLALEEVIVKLNNSYRHHLTNAEIEQHLRLIEKSVPGWLIFHEVRGTLFVKVSRDGDMKKVMTRLDQLAKEKSG